jgi:hydroxycarboxylate dehydrogenase B
VARNLVGSDLAGMTSHGVRRIASYYSFLQKGWLKPSAEPEVIRDSPATATVDGHWGFGQPAMHRALEIAIAKSRNQGIAAVGVIHSGHVGRLGEYAERAAEAGTIALLTASGGPPGGLVVPFGGAERVLSTNPIAAGVPAARHPPFVMDFATSVVAAGKIEFAPDKDRAIPEGWALDSQGQSARTARAFLEGGALLPFGGHKGYGICMLVELLAGGLTGGGLSERPDRIVTEGAGGNAGLAIVMDIAHFIDLQEFHESVDAFFDRLKRVKPAAGFSEVMIPGEPELRQRRALEPSGFRVDEEAWQKINEIARTHGVALDDL